MKSIYLFILLEIMFLLLPVFPVNAALPGESCTPYTSSESIARFPTIGWEYKNINGVAYRRLYNYSTNTPCVRELAPSR